MKEIVGNVAYSPRSKRGRDYQMGAHTLRGIFGICILLFLYFVLRILHTRRGQKEVVTIKWELTLYKVIFCETSSLVRVLDLDGTIIISEQPS